MIVCGVDETGRGSSISGVWVSACILDPNNPIEGLRDSKKLSAKKREALVEEIKAKAICWNVEIATLEEVEQLNVLNATLLAMKRAVEGLRIQPDRVFVDGNTLPDLAIPAEAIVKGDDLIPAISAASILAKVARDKAVRELHREYPHYGFDKHKGYLTKNHMAALQKYGPSPIHRKTYAPIRNLLHMQLELF